MLWLSLTHLLANKNITRHSLDALTHAICLNIARQFIFFLNVISHFLRKAIGIRDRRI